MTFSDAGFLGVLRVKLQLRSNKQILSFLGDFCEQVHSMYMYIVYAATVI